MQITSFILGLGSLPQEDKQKKQYFQLSENEQACYHRIVTDLTLCCQGRVVGPSMSSHVQEGRQAYAIIFQQSYSWRKIEQKLNSINTSIINEAVQKMTAGWKTRINTLRTLQNEICDYTKEIRKYKKQLNDSSLLKEDLVAIGISKELAAARIEYNASEIQRHLKKAKNKLDKQLKNHQITKYKTCNDLLIRLVMHWQQLCVFSDCPEISIGKKKLCVKIRNSLSSFDHKVSMATKAIFIIEEQELKETIVRDVPGKRGTITRKMLRPKGVSLKETCFAPATPSPGKRVPSTIELTNELIFDFPFKKEDNTPNRNKSDNTKTVTSLAARLEYMVHRALDRVNSDLSTGSTDGILSDLESGDDSLFQEEDFSPPSGFNRFLLSLTPIFFSSSA